MDALARKMAQSPWSDSNIKQMCGGKVNVLTVKQAVELGDIEKVFGPHGAAVLLFETEPNYGHWVALIRVDGHTVEWFDSYGLAPQGELKMIPKEFARKSLQDEPYLNDMIEDGGYRTIFFNEYPLQSKGQKVSTCGRWAATRVALKDLPLEAFVKLFVGQKCTPDEYISMLTAFVH